jgi:hypothetical protein
LQEYNKIAGDFKGDVFQEEAARISMENRLGDLEINKNEKVELAKRNEQLKTVQEYDKYWKEIQSGLADALYTSLTEGGKKGAVKVKDLIRAQLKKLAMEPINLVVNLVMDTSKALLSGALNWLTGGKTGNSWVDTALDVVSGGKSLYDIYNGQSSIGTALGVVNQASIYSGLTYGTGFGTQQSAMLAAQEAGMGAPSLWNGVANTFGEIAGNITGKIAGQEIGKAATTEAAKQSATATTSMWSNMFNVAGAGLSAYGVGLWCRSKVRYSSRYCSRYSCWCWYICCRFCCSGGCLCWWCSSRYGWCVFCPCCHTCMGLDCCCCSRIVWCI